jgi:hypothetical protein
VLFLALVVIVFVSIVGLLLQVNLRIPGKGGDFLLIWSAGRGFLFEQIDPYSWTVASRVQNLVYGDAAPPGSDPFILTIPFHLLLLYFPFSLISDPGLARASFTLVLEAALIWTMIVGLGLTERNYPKVLYATFILFGLVNYYSVQAIKDANPVVLIGLVLMSILSWMRTEMDEVVGALIAISLYYLEAGGLFLALVAIMNFRLGKVRALAGFLMVSLILISISLLSYPGWLFPYLRALAADGRMTYGESMGTILSHYWPEQAIWITLLLALTFGILVSFEWKFFRNRESAGFIWISFLILSITPLVGFRWEMECLVVLIPAQAFVIKSIMERWKDSGAILAMLYILLMFLIPWGAHYSDQLGTLVPEGFTYLFLPVATLISLYWVRWWAFRTPKPWLEQMDRLK